MSSQTVRKLLILKLMGSGIDFATYLRGMRNHRDWYVGWCCWVALLGCSDLDLGRGTDGSASEAQQLSAADVAKSLFSDKVLPLLEAKCAACHSGGYDLAPAFLKADPDVYTVLKGSTGIVNFSDPSASRLLTKGRHEGPPWAKEEAEVIAEWLSKEVEALPKLDDSRLHTETVVPKDGLNVFDLSTVATGLEGALLSFEWTGSSISSGAQQSVVVYQMANLGIAAGGSGVQAKYPQLVQFRNGGTFLDVLDRFRSVNLRIAASQTALLATGNVLFTEFPDGGVRFYFEAIGPLNGVGSGDGSTLPGTGGNVCKQVAAFTNNVVPAAQTSCLSCHGGANAAAFASFSMAGINDASSNSQRNACANFLAKVNLVSPDSSILLTKPSPTGPSHPFKFNNAQFNTFRSAMLAWINPEGG